MPVFSTMQEKSGLKRSLGLWECVFFGIGSILGAGIYALLGKVAGVSGTMIWASFLIASLTALFSAFSYAELSAALPRSGGEFKYAREAFGKSAGGVLGTLISLNGTISGAAVSIGFAGYLAELVRFPVLPASLGIILLVFLVNLWGIRQSSTMNIIFTIIEVGGLGLAVYCATMNLGETDYLNLPRDGWRAVFIGAALSFFAYIGFEEVVKLAEETKDPGKTIPKALFIAGGIVFIVYTLVALTAVSAIGPETLGTSESPLARVVELELGAAGVTIISLIALFSTTNTILANMMGSSRVVYNMGKEIRPLNWFGKVFKTRKTPARALLLVVALMILVAMIGKLQFVALLANFFIFLTFLTVNLCAIVLRFRQPDLERPYRIPFSLGKVPLPSILGILFTLFLLSFTILALMEGVEF